VFCHDRQAVGGHLDLPAGGHEEDTMAITECDRIARALRRYADAERRIGVNLF